jgi:hypothetical protein
MATLSYYKLVIDGPAARVMEFRTDEDVWKVEPWLEFYGGPDLREDHAVADRLVYMWADDYKREGPSVARIAAGYPELTMVLEWSDEFGGVAERVRYVDGKQADSARVDPEELEWMEWQDDQGEE